jgi:general secretion pathway protein H
MTQRQAGFTLIELLVGLAIMAGAALLAMPVTRSAVAAQTLYSAAIDIAASARMTRAAAIRTGAVQTLLIDVTTRRYGGSGHSGVGSRVLPVTLRLALVVPPGEQSGDTGHIRFWPSGGSSGGRLVLSDGRSSTFVEIDWLTGGAHVGR